MAKNTEIANWLADSIAQRLVNGYVRIYDANSILLVQLRYDGFDEPVDGIATARILPELGIANGRAKRAQHLEADGQTVVFETSVGTSRAELILDNVDIEIGSPVVIEGFTIKVKQT